MTPVISFSGDEWRGRVGQSWASEWRRTDRSFGTLTARLVDAFLGVLSAPNGGPRRRILDIGCGAGETALRLAQLRPDFDVVGLDLSEDLIAIARERGTTQSNLSFVAGDAARWRDDRPYDAAVSRHGLMFFDDPVAALAHLHDLMVRGAPLVFSCFAARADNIWTTEIAALTGAPAPADPHAPGPFAFADAERVQDILHSAGWGDAACDRIDYGYLAGGGADPVHDACDFFMRIGPAARHMATLDEATRQQLEPRLVAWLAAYDNDGFVRLPASAWLWRATA